MRTGTGNEIQWGIVNAEGVFAGRCGCPGDIIHVEDVRFGFPLSAEARRGEWLPSWRDVFEFVAEIVEVFLADVQGQYFFYHGQEIS